MRRFDAQTGIFIRPKDYRPGDYRDSFQDILKPATPVHVSRQPNLEKHCQDRLPQELLTELRGQIPENLEKYATVRGLSRCGEGSDAGEVV
jgi:hypothetical protein